MTVHYSPNWIEKQAQKDRMKLSDRGGEVVAIVIIVLVVSFFYAHEDRSTGFFTSSFGTLERALFYGAIIVGAAGPLTRLATGRRNVARPVEMLSSLIWIVSLAWWLQVFPFDFSHLTDVVPESFRFLASWITNDVAKAFIPLGIFIGIVSIVVNAIFYVKVRALLNNKSSTRRFQ